MKKFIKKYLCIETEGKLCEKTLFRYITVAVVGIVLCMASMGFSAYAYFTSNITSGNNTLKAANYGIEVTVTDEAGTVLTANAGNSYPTYQLEMDTYQVKITASGTASKGYCKIIVGNEITKNEITGSEDYYTISLAPDEELTFTIQNHKDVAVLQFIANWGSCSETDEAKIVARSEEQPEMITFGTASDSANASQASDVTLQASDASQEDATQPPSSNAEESASNSDDVQQNGDQENQTSGDVTAGGEGDATPTDDTTSTDGTTPADDTAPTDGTTNTTE